MPIGIASISGGGPRARRVASFLWKNFWLSNGEALASVRVAIGNEALYPL
jgi:hypothetical protein